MFIPFGMTKAICEPGFRHAISGVTGGGDGHTRFQASSTVLPLGIEEVYLTLFVFFWNLQRYKTLKWTIAFTNLKDSFISTNYDWGAGQ